MLGAARLDHYWSCVCRVRRGLVRIENKQYSATAVVGIKFTDKAIR